MIILFRNAARIILINLSVFMNEASESLVLSLENNDQQNIFQLVTSC